MIVDTVRASAGQVPQIASSCHLCRYLMGGEPIQKVDSPEDVGPKGRSETGIDE